MVRWNSRSQIRKRTGSSQAASCATIESSSRLMSSALRLPRRVGHDRRLDEQAGGMHRVEAVAVDRGRVGDADALRADVDVDVGDAGARALRDLDDAFAGEPLDGAAHCLAADHQHGRKFALARELVANLQNAGRDQRDDLVADHLLGCLLVDRFMERRKGNRHAVHRQLDC